ncbi:uncharacterized protein LOC127102379 [Lathyrus oleraceus]|uniref:uncharacterized protein LOC127102379 n=1 Tax=Pisum sativum TaxID=3888 RepID=UPI0021CE6EC2|nr:uncharacterized protein LOC127102379 [Pisum sativum]
MGLILSTMNSGLVIDTPVNMSVTTSLVCMNWRLSINGKDFGIDLICLVLEDMDAIMGMTWLKFNHVSFNCYNKTLWFLAPEDEAKSFSMFASVSVESQANIEGLPVVCEFPEVFPDDMFGFSPKRVVEFTSNLVLGTRTVSTEPYKMVASKL